MEKLIKISIIVPVYNVAEYLRRCLDSCIYQTLQEIEIIIVNDGSPDKRDSEIMKEYAKRFPQKVKLIWHDVNKGLGDARNTGICAAVGEFIQFVDSDDYIDLFMCEKMYAKATSESADLVLCNVNILQNGKLIPNWNEFRVTDSFDKRDRLSEVSIYSSWRLIVKKDLLQNNNLHFPKRIYFEDFICCLWHLAANKIAYVTEPLYYYIQRPGSICNSGDREEDYERRKDIFKCIRFIFNTTYFSSLSLEFKKVVFIYLLNSFLLSEFQNMAENNSDRIKEWCDELRYVRNDFDVDLNDEVFSRDSDALTIRDLLKFIDEHCYDLNFSEQSRDYYNLLMLYRIQNRLYLLRNRRIVVWGAGKRGQRLAEYLIKLNIPFKFTDKNASIQGLDIKGIRVESWNELSEQTDVVIVSALGIYDYVKTEINNNNITVLDYQELTKIE